MKKFLFAITSVVAMCFCNIANICATEIQGLFREYWGAYMHLRQQIEASSQSDQKEAAIKFVNELFHKDLSSCVISELKDVSRLPTQNESEAVLELVSLIQSKGIRIDEVRVMDALSIVSYFTDESIKIATFDVLYRAKEENCRDSCCVDFIRKGIDNSKFLPARLKNRVRETVEQGCALSKSFRILFAAALGQVSSCSPRICDQMSPVPIQKGSDYMIFEDGPWSFSGGNVITLIQDPNGICENSFFCNSGSPKRTGAGSFAVAPDDVSILYHEVGHLLSADFWKSTEIFRINETLRLIAALSNNLSFDKKALNEFFELSLAAPGGIEVQERFIVNCFLGPVFSQAKDLDVMKALMARLGASDEGIAQLLHLNSVEIFQILGLGLVKNGEENILFINSLSDFALAAELGLPIRADHTSFALNPQKIEYGFLLPKKPFVNHSINLDFYGAMLKIYGSSMQQYMMKIMYGDNLSHALMMEWRLVKECIVLQCLHNILHI